MTYLLVVCNISIPKDLEDVYRSTLCYVKFDNEHKIYILRKLLYELKQTPRTLVLSYRNLFLKGFQKYPYERILFIKIEDGGKCL